MRGSVLRKRRMLLLSYGAQWGRALHHVGALELGLKGLKSGG